MFWLGGGLILLDYIWCFLMDLGVSKVRKCFFGCLDY